MRNTANCLFFLGCQLRLRGKVHRFPWTKYAAQMLGIYAPPCPPPIDGMRSQRKNSWFSRGVKSIARPAAQNQPTSIKQKRIPRVACAHDAMTSFSLIWQGRICAQWHHPAAMLWNCLGCTLSELGYKNELGAWNWTSSNSNCSWGNLHTWILPTQCVKNFWGFLGIHFWN